MRFIVYAYVKPNKNFDSMCSTLPAGESDFKGTNKPSRMHKEPRYKRGDVVWVLCGNREWWPGVVASEDVWKALQAHHSADGVGVFVVKERPGYELVGEESLHGFEENVKRVVGENSSEELRRAVETVRMGSVEFPPLVLPPRRRRTSIASICGEGVCKRRQSVRRDRARKVSEEPRETEDKGSDKELCEEAKGGPEDAKEMGLELAEEQRLSETAGVCSEEGHEEEVVVTEAETGEAYNGDGELENVVETGCDEQCQEVGNGLSAEVGAEEIDAAVGCVDEGCGEEGGLTCIKDVPVENTEKSVN